MSITDERVYTYKDAEELCRKAFDAGKDYATASLRYGVNAVAYDWEHWFKRNEYLFMPTQTVEDVLCEFFSRYATTKPKEEDDAILAEYAAKLRLAGDAE